MVSRLSPFYRDDFGVKVPGDMEEDEFGDFVDYAEYERLEEENAELRAAINKLREDER